MTNPMPASDNPQDSAETLRIMTRLEQLADEDPPRPFQYAAKAMDEARHRLAVLQQFANGQGPCANLTENGMQTLARLAARIERLEAALREAATDLESASDEAESPPDHARSPHGHWRECAASARKALE